MRKWSTEAGIPPEPRSRGGPQGTQQRYNTNNDPMAGISQAPADTSTFRPTSLGNNRPYVSRRGPDLRPAPDNFSNSENVAEEEFSALERDIREAEAVRLGARSLRQRDEIIHRPDERNIAQRGADLDRKIQELDSTRRRLAQQRTVDEARHQGDPGTIRHLQATMMQTIPQLESMESKISKQAAELNAAKTRHQKNATRIAELEAKLKQNDQEKAIIFDLQTTIMENDQQLASSHKRLSAYAKKIRKLEGELSELKGRAMPYETPHLLKRPSMRMNHSATLPGSLQPSLLAQPRNRPRTPPSYPAKKPRTHSPNVSDEDDAAKMTETTHVSQTAGRPRAVHTAEVEQRVDTNQVAEKVEVIDLLDVEIASSSEIDSNDAEERRGPVSQQSVPPPLRHILSCGSVGRSQRPQERVGSSFTMPPPTTSSFDYRSSYPTLGLEVAQVPQAKQRQPPPKKKTPASKTAKAAGASAHQIADLWSRIDFVDMSAPGGRRSGEELSESLKAQLAPGFAKFCQSDIHWGRLTAKPMKVQSTCSQQRVHGQTTTETQLHTCDYCISKGLPCVYSTRDYRPLMVSLPEHQRRGIAPGDIRYWILQLESG
ncbi:Hypothetical predicted protein [Lecanosticta acicola]|uniref:Uncharacterized protein n=1 Tax=Lecanosticta acicola TaxID=111012 RepID=A0AAI9E8W6_9PEZI|nr:Hypothetical predicted protein [Lecanosticta acicola]